MYGHVNEKGKFGHKYKWVQQLKNLGLKPIIQVWDTVPKEEADFWECHYISLLKSWGIRLTNFTDGGGNPPIIRRFGVDNVFVSREKVREKILAMNKSRKGKTFIEMYGEERAGELKELKSKRFSGKNNPMFGKAMSEETKDRISKGNKGKTLGMKRSDEFKNNLSKKLTGRVVSEKTKLIMREIALKRPPMSDAAREKIGKAQSEKSKGLIYQLDIKTKVLIKQWSGFSEITKYFGKKSANICSCVTGKLKSAYGFYWTRHNSEINSISRSQNPSICQ